MKRADLIKGIIDSIPEDYATREIRVCCYWTAVLSNRCGLASTFIPPCPHNGRPAARDTGELTKKSAKTLALLSLSDSLLEATIGMAALNSLIEIDESRCTQENAITAILPHSEGKKVVMVGHFPFADKLEKSAKSFVVLQRAKGENPVYDENEKAALSEADTVMITGTSLINHSMDMLLEHTNRKAVKMMLGPTTPLSPVLFDYGFDYLSGVKVIDETETVKCISEGATFREVKGIRLLTMKKENIPSP